MWILLSGKRSSETLSPYLFGNGTQMGLQHGEPPPVSVELPPLSLLRGWRDRRTPQSFASLAKALRNLFPSIFKITARLSIKGKVGQPGVKGGWGQTGCDILMPSCSGDVGSPTHLSHLACEADPDNDLTCGAKKVLCWMDQLA